MVLVGKPERKNYLGDPGIDGRIILRWIFRKWDAIALLSTETLFADQQKGKDQRSSYWCTVLLIP
jgi:hypothetical protein